jgi:hypothetical protein
MPNESTSPKIDREQLRQARVTAAKVVIDMALAGRRRFKLATLAEAADVLLSDREWLEEHSHD